MIGQIELISTIKDQIENEVFPRFSIFVGQKGSGKKTLANMLPGFFKGSDISYVLEDVKVDTIRDMIEQSYKTVTRTFYIIPDADGMSLAAKNAILKVTEEPPNNAYFVMTVEDEYKLLNTIRSRGTIYHMDNYTPEEIWEYASNLKHDFILDEKEAIIDLCQTPGEVNTMLKTSILDFTNYVKLVVDSIATVSGANSFKIADKVALKDEDGKYDLKLFWKAFMKECFGLINDNPYKYQKGIQITSSHLQEISITGINKTMLFDDWVLSIRQEWLE